MRIFSRAIGFAAISVVILGAALTWFMGNFLYSLLWAWLDSQHVREADVIAYTLAHITPFLLSLLLVAGIYFLLRLEFRREIGRKPECDIPLTAEPVFTGTAALSKINWQHTLDFLKNYKWHISILIFGMIIFYSGREVYRGLVPVGTPPAEPALMQAMETDFPGLDSLSGIWLVIIYSDLRMMSKFITFYVNNDVFLVTRQLASDLDKIIKGPPMLTIDGKPVDSRMTITKQFKGDNNYQSSDNEIFTGAVYIYYEGHLEDEQRVELRRIFKDHNSTLMFRSNEGN
jgi:hypothetical protein